MENYVNYLGFSFNRNILVKKIHRTFTVLKNLKITLEYDHVFSTLINYFLTRIYFNFLLPNLTFN